MAVVNEDPVMVKFLLDNGADVNARAIGKFFCADDQKETRGEVLDHEWYLMKTQTNYQGSVSFSLSKSPCIPLGLRNLGNPGYIKCPKSKFPVFGRVQCETETIVFVEHCFKW